jgi:hypothetical protein
VPTPTDQNHDGADDFNHARRMAKPLPKPDGLELLDHYGLTGQFHETGEEEQAGYHDAQKFGDH